MAKRDLEIVAACVIALRAFDPANFDPSFGLTGAADISSLGYEDLERGEYLLSTMSDEDIAAALAETELDIASVERAS